MSTVKDDRDRLLHIIMRLLVACNDYALYMSTVIELEERFGFCVNCEDSTNICICEGEEQ